MTLTKISKDTLDYSLISAVLDNNDKAFTILMERYESQAMYYYKKVSDLMGVRQRIGWEDFLAEANLRLLELVTKFRKENIGNKNIISYYQESSTSWIPLSYEYKLVYMNKCLLSKQIRAIRGEVLGARACIDFSSIHSDVEVVDIALLNSKVISTPKASLAKATKEERLELLENSDVLQQLKYEVSFNEWSLLKLLINKTHKNVIMNTLGARGAEYEEVVDSLKLKVFKYLGSSLPTNDRSVTC